MIKYIVWNPICFLFAVLIGSCYHSWSAWGPTNAGGCQTKDCLKCGKERARKVKHYNSAPPKHYHKWSKWRFIRNWDSLGDDTLQERTCEECNYIERWVFAGKRGDDID